ncbi:hypothetical protein LI90_2655 [Carbonactinospora thermoautotrophica]|uniref:Uncharacterized protein n=1 Tax=Carbonactinospora thermoautotrophica TaxID=1469144 RepID=A0A132MUV3_9ACTN|nr:hypothetical protein LI90_2655 [Carbonactinospora thermoautotrophica]
MLTTPQPVPHRGPVAHRRPPGTPQLGIRRSCPVSPGCLTALPPLGRSGDCSGPIGGNRRGFVENRRADLGESGSGRAARDRYPLHGYPSHHLGVQRHRARSHSDRALRMGWSIAGHGSRAALNRPGTRENRDDLGWQTAVRSMRTDEDERVKTQRPIPGRPFRLRARAWSRLRRLRSLIVPTAGAGRPLVDLPAPGMASGVASVQGRARRCSQCCMAARCAELLWGTASRPVMSAIAPAIQEVQAAPVMSAYPNSHGDRNRTNPTRACAHSAATIPGCAKDQRETRASTAPRMMSAHMAPVLVSVQMGDSRA